MLNPSEKAYCLALQALKQKRYTEAVSYFERAAGYFENNREFSLLRETTRLLVALKRELATAGDEEDTLIIEETFSDGQETNLPG
jgi:hypothetical protein